MGPFDNIGQNTQGPDSAPTNDIGTRILGGLQEFSQTGSGFGNMVGLGLALTGNSPGQNPVGTPEERMLTQGMNDLSNEVAKVKDPARAVINYAQSENGKALGRIPGMFPKLLDRFHESLKQPQMQSAVIGQGETGAINKGGIYGTTEQTQNPQAVTTPQGAGTNLVGAKGFTGQSFSQPTAETQTFNAYAKMFESMPGADKLLPQMAALAAAGPNAISQRMVLANNMKNLGAPSDAADAFANGLWNVVKSDIPNQFYISSVLEPGAIHLITLGPQPAKSLVPTYSSTGANPETFSSTPPLPNQRPPGAGPGAGQSQAAPPTPENQKLAAKYNAPVEALKPDGTLDPIKAYGPNALFPLGGGLPAMIQNTAGMVARWFDPSQTNEQSEIISKAEIGMNSLRFLQGALASTGGNRMLKDMWDAAQELGPEHEKWNDPQYATREFIQMRTTLEGLARTNSENITNLLQSGMKMDNSMIADMSKQQLAIQNVLNFLPSTQALQGMLQAIQDGKVKGVPSFATAATTVGSVAKSAVGHGLGLVFNNGTVDNINADPQGSISKIQTMGPKELMQSKKVYGQLNPAIQRAIDARWDALRGGNKPQGPKAQQFAPGEGKRPGPSVQQFIQNPDNPGLPQNGGSMGSRTFDERFPSPAIGGGKGPSMDRAFSNINNQFPLGNALRKKAANPFQP